MTPGKSFRQRTTFRRRMTVGGIALLVLAFIILECTSPNVQPAFAQDTIVKSYCASDTTQAVVYFSEIFDTG
ncbi:MAG TPA: hypothetical protein VIX37_01985, partial [Candidatus Sulfotelmatobacter sp.]